MDIRSNPQQRPLLPEKRGRFSESIAPCCGGCYSYTITVPLNTQEVEVC